MNLSIGQRNGVLDEIACDPDGKTWDVIFTVKNVDCPARFWYAGIHWCKRLPDGEDSCDASNCPLRVK